LARSTDAAEQNMVSSTIEAVEDSHGRIFILGAGSRITIVDERLRLLGVVSQSSDGSALFRDAISIGVLADGRIAVLDRGRRTIRVMRAIRGGSALVTTDTVSVGMSAEGMCVLGGNRFLIYGADHGMRLHVVDVRGVALRSFAPADPRQSDAVQDQFAMGQLGCDQQADQVIVTSAFLPTVEAFRISTGERTWIDTLRPYRAVTITLQGRGLSIISGPGGHSLIRTVTALGTCRLFQTVNVARQDGQSPDTILSYVYREGERTWAPAQLGIARLVPLSPGKVLSLPASHSPLQLQRLSIDGCARASQLTNHRTP
jgi:hypothetical protein